MLGWLEAVADRLPFPLRMADEWLSMFAASLAVSEEDAATARERLPLAISLSGERRDMPDVAVATQIGARLLALEGKPERSAWALGVSRAVRGAFDEGDPELRALVTELKESLGDGGFQDAFDTGARLGKEAAIAELRAEFLD